MVLGMASTGYVSVTSLFHSVGGIEGKRVTDWRKRKDIKKFLGDLSTQMSTSIQGRYDSGALIEYERGRGSPTYMHPLVAEEYSRYLVSSKSSPCLLYFVHARGSRFFKIGVTADLESRMKSLQIANPYELVVIALKKSKNAEVIEAKLHKKLRLQHVRGEWFELSPGEEEIIKNIFFDSQSSRSQVDQRRV